ncbi:hypothetical protein [uncultured Pseudacidovorax sp.]|uniref:hypothetical protein n=1 Tax=uncultured Pseudacidovorax sp. TaxID=679313 RepID=UPI0025E2732F|nr:hypothetical protein [uncultured Pseudacidovorax sp.]
MSKDETGGLFSKVAKFVRNPLKDWSELEDAPGGSIEPGYSREALKELMERRQRNDFVRRREFDMLRKLRQRGGAEDPGNISSSLPSSDRPTDRRALTLRKIDEIEAQMSQQWWTSESSATGPGGVGETSPGGTAAADASLAEHHARAYADTAPVVPTDLQPPREAAPPVPHAMALLASAVPPPVPGETPRLAFDTPLEEAAVRFAQGDDAGAESALRQALVPGSAFADQLQTWRALLDFYRATGDAERFAEAAVPYAERFSLPMPVWVSLHALAREARTGEVAQRLDARAAADWEAPARLDRPALLALTQALSRAKGNVWRLDWRGLRQIEADAVQPLTTLVTHWALSPVQMGFMGTERLLDVLTAATPLGERGVDAGWWSLHLAVLRLLNRLDEFELVALNYCITYEITPPSWQAPRGTVAEMGDAIVPSARGALEPVATRGAVLAGELAGADSLPWLRIEEALDRPGAAPEIDCTALVRMDLAAAEALRARLGARPGLRLLEVQGVLAEFLRLTGVDRCAVVTPRAG